MNTNTNLKSLTPVEIKMLKKKFGEFTFAQDFHLIYEHHIPNTAIVLLDGIIELNKRRRKFLEVVQPGFMIGVPNLIKSVPFKFNCLLRGNSTVLLLPKSELLEILRDKDSPLYPIFSSMGLEEEGRS